MKRASLSNLKSLNSVVSVIDRARRAGEMEYVIHFAAVERLIDVDLLEFELWFVAEVIEIGSSSGQQIIDDDDGITLCQQCIAQMGTQEAGSAGDQRPQLAHEWLAFLGGMVASRAGDSGVAAGRPTL